MAKETSKWHLAFKMRRESRTSHGDRWGIGTCYCYSSRYPSNQLLLLLLLLTTTTLGPVCTFCLNENGDDDGTGTFVPAIGDGNMPFGRSKK